MEACLKNRATDMKKEKLETNFMINLFFPVLFTFHRPKRIYEALHKYSIIFRYSEYGARENHRSASVDGGFRPAWIETFRIWT